MSNTKGNGKMIKSLVMVFKFGMMEKHIRGSGLIIWHMGKVNYSIKTAMSTKETGNMIKLTAKVNMFTKMVHIMKVIGNMISNMDLPLKCYLIRPGLKVNFLKE